MTSAYAAGLGYSPAVRSGIAGVGSFLPSRVVTSQEVERRLVMESAVTGFTPRPGRILRRSGVAERRYMDPVDDVSDLAARAACAALDDAGLAPEEVPLLIFASASQDLIEPATAHLVSMKLGGPRAVFDVKNACNSFLSGMQVADALIRSGQYGRALVCTGEAPSMAIRWKVSDRRQLRECSVGYTLGDAGAAVVLERRADGSGIEHVAFQSGSGHWDLCTVRGGGSMHGSDAEHFFFRGHGEQLRDAFETWGYSEFEKMLSSIGSVVDDFDFVLVHQVTAAFLDDFLRVTGVRPERTIPIVHRLGNVASASIPLQLEKARRHGLVASGSRVLLVGLGAGISLGLITLRM